MRSFDEKGREKKSTVPRCGEKFNRKLHSIFVCCWQGLTGRGNPHADEESVWSWSAGRGEEEGWSVLSIRKAFGHQHKWVSRLGGGHGGGTTSLFGLLLLS